MTITRLTTTDVRFPTSRELDGSDAMNPDPDYSAAYVVIEAEDGSRGDGFVFTIGRGNEVVVAALDALRSHVVGRSLEGPADLAELSRSMIHDSQLRWLGPEKGVMHMAVGAVVNAAWDLVSRRAGMPLWQYVSSLTPEELVDQVDFRYLTDALDRDEALAILRAAEPGRAERSARLLETGYPAYTTSSGWLGYDDAKVERLSREAVADGFRQIKLKVGGDLADDVRRVGIARAAVGPDIRVAVDANQRWDVSEAVDVDEGPRALRPVVDRGADEPRRRARPCGDPRPGRADQGGDGRARAEPGGLQAAAPGRRDRRPPARRRTGRRSRTRTSRSCCWPPSSTCRSARTPAVSGSASSCSTCR